VFIREENAVSVFSRQRIFLHNCHAWIVPNPFINVDLDRSHAKIVPRNLFCVYADKNVTSSGKQTKGKK
jgi:hypothetical protein